MRFPRGWTALAMASAMLVAPSVRATELPVVASQCATPPGFAPPFTRVYHLRAGGTLVFVAVEHTRDVGDASHRQIAQAIQHYRPDVVLVEGINAGSPAAIAFQRAAAERQFNDGAIQETLYAVKLAADRGIAFASWDFSPDEAMRRDVGGGYALADVVGAHLLRAGVDPALPAADQPAMRRELAYAARTGSIDGYDYAAWYARHYPAPVEAAERTPCGTGIASRILKAESDARSRNLADLVASRATPGRVLLVEAGANHWVALGPYLNGISTSMDRAIEPAM